MANYPIFHTGFMLLMLFPGVSIVVYSFMSSMPMLSNMLIRNGFIYAHTKGVRRTKHAINAVIESGKISSTIILPEGKRAPDGQIQEFKRGFIHILRHSLLDLLPVTLSGFYHLKPVNRLYINPDTELEVIIKKPISHSIIKALNDEQLLAEILNAIEGFNKP
jgi:1-acyl-sn-glycerol-3-phosphate acyltransferase